jgi:uncharacterized membrane protein
MTVDVEVATVIRRPVDEVWAYAADPTNAPEWYSNIDSAEWKTTPPVAVGSLVEFVARFLGRTLRYTYEFVEVVPDTILKMRTEQGPFPMETTYTLHAEGDASTRMTLRNRGTPMGFAAVVAPVMARAVRRATTHDLARLKAIMEGGAER